MLFNNVALIAFVFCTLSCSERKKYEPIREKGKSISQISSDYDSLIYRVKFKGDSIAFEELYYGYLDSGLDYRTDSLMYYSNIMAEKYNYPDAYIIYFDAFLMKNNIFFDGFRNLNLSSLSIKNREKAKEHLDIMLRKKIISKKDYDSIKW